MEELWADALKFLSQKLGAARAVILHEEDPARDFEVIASSGIDGEAFWRDPNIDFGVLASVCSSGLPENRRNQLLCAPARDRNGRVVALLYADRPEKSFGLQALTNLAEFTREFETRLMAVHTTRNQTQARTLSKVGGINTRVAFLLAEQGLLSLDEAEEAVGQAQAAGEILERILVDSGRLREEELLRALARYYQLEPWLVNLGQINPEIARMVPIEKAQTMGAVPIGLSGDQLAVALALPDNSPSLEELRKISGRNLVVRLVGRLGFQRILNALEALGETRAETTEPAPAPAAPSVALGGPLLAGRYRVEDAPMLVCRFSSLLRAQDTVSKQAVVLRRLEPPAQEDVEAARRQTLNEGQMMSQLWHRNLPRVERVLEDEQQVYLVLEDFSGSTLEQLVNQHGPVPPSSMAHIIEQLLSVSEYLHSQNPPIIHRDLRPDVLMLCPDGTVKLVEFGLAKMQTGAATVSSSTSFRAYGSPFFASPEQLLGEPSHTRQDIYSLGAILYFLATGTTPDKSLERCFSQGMKDATTSPIQKLRPGFPANLEQFIEALHEPDGDTRPGSVAEARKLLRQLISGKSGETPPPQPVSSPPSVPPQGGDPSPPSVPPQGGDSPLREETPAEAAKPEPTPPVQADTGRAAPAKILLSDSAPAARGPLPAELELLDRLLPRKEPAAVAVSSPPERAEEAVAEPLADPTPVARTAPAPAAAQAAPEPVEVSVAAPVARPGPKPVPRSNQLPSEGGAFHRLMGDAIGAGASDVHFEPDDDETLVRWRVDGVLRQVESLDSTTAAQVLLAAKQLVGLESGPDSARSGHCQYSSGPQRYNLGVSLMPVAAGESLVIRISSRGPFVMNLADLGLPAQSQERLRQILALPHGLVLVGGPPQAGKSSTLYACLRELHGPERKFVTLEDPVRYKMLGVMQVQVSPHRLTCARALQELQGQDPDVVLVGQILDPETAQATLEVAMRGQQVLAGVRSPEALANLTRLRELGCDPHRLAATVNGCLAQRLARRLCASCREEASVGGDYQATFERYRITPRMFVARGCGDCNETGYKGRIGIFEVLTLSSELRALIAGSSPADELRRVAVSQGFQPMLQDGLHKVVSGLTSMEELLRVCR